MNIESCYKICTDIATPAGSARYYSLRFLEKNKRNALIALYAWQHELLAIKRNCSDKNVGLAKLNWWRTETHKMFEKIAEHPVAQALQHSLEKFPLHLQRFNNILNAVETDLTIETYQTDNELQEFFKRCGGETEILATTILGYQQQETLHYARQLGTALQWLDYLLHLRHDLLANRLYISNEQLQKYAVQVSLFIQKPLPPSVIQLLAEQFDTINSVLQETATLLPASDQLLQYPSLIMLRIQTRLIKIIASENYDILNQQVKLTPLAMLWIAFRLYCEN